MNNNKQIFLENLPRHRGKNIDWEKSVGNTVNFFYDDIEGEIEIVSYDTKSGYLKIQYLNHDIFRIKYGNFTNCKLGKLLGKKTSEFKVKIGTRFVGNKRDLVIMDREYRKDSNGFNRKYYKYKCNVCGFCDDGSWMLESDLLNKGGCACCRGAIIVLGINSIFDTTPWLVKYFKNPEDAKLYTKSSSALINPICPDCGQIKNKSMSINSIYNTRSIGCQCSDGISYPNKFAYSLLNQLNETYKFDYLEHEYSPEWIKPKRYDNYFEYNNKKYILEMDGSLGHGNEIHSKSNMTIEESIAIDNYKDDMAKKYNIIVIRIDCQKSDMEYIKNNILDSKLNGIFDLSIIQWNKIEEYALSNIVLETCKLKSENQDFSTTDIGNIMGIHKCTVIRYLKKGTKIWDWVKYNPEDETSKFCSKAGKMGGKQIEVFKDDSNLGIFTSIMELEKQSESLFGVKLLHSKISAVCLGKRKHHKGFTFKYVNNNNEALLQVASF